MEARFICKLPVESLRVGWRCMGHALRGPPKRIGCTQPRELQFLTRLPDCCSRELAQEAWRHADRILANLATVSVSGSLLRCLPGIGSLGKITGNTKVSSSEGESPCPPNESELSIARRSQGLRGFSPIRDSALRSLLRSRSFTPVITERELGNVHLQDEVRRLGVDHHFAEVYDGYFTVTACTSNFWIVASRRCRVCCRTYCCMICKSYGKTW